MTSAKMRGDRGEAAAADYLTQRGYVIEARQWRCRYGELDLVARDPSGVRCFVEVKLRSGTAHGLPREFVDARKQLRLRKAALAYLAACGDPDSFARFDVAEVYAAEGMPLRVTYLENAFE